MNLIEVRPIEKKSWHGKKGKESFKRPQKLSALVNGETMEYCTGLTDEEEEKYSKILRQDLSRQFNPEVPHPFWDSPMAVVLLEDKTMFFNLDIPLDFIKYKFMKASRFVANSVQEYNNGKFPSATHVIFDEREEVEVRAKKIVIKEKAIIEAAKLTDNQKAEIILLLDGKLVKGKSSDYLRVEMYKLIEKDPALTLRYIQRDSSEIAAQALVTEAIEKSVLRKSGHKIMYHDHNLGSEISEVARYLEQPDNQTLKIRIMEALN